MDLIIALLKAHYELTQLGHRHFEVLPIVTLVICQAICLESLFKRTWYIPGAALADKRLNLGASAVTMDIRKIRRHHVVDDTNAKVAWQKRRWYIKVVDVGTADCLREAEHVGGADNRRLVS